MYNKCCIVGCDSRRKDVNFYRFPKNEKRLKTWLKCINCDLLRSLNMEEIHKRFVCQKHFEKRFIVMNTSRSRLRVGAYPSLFSDSEIHSGITQTAILEDTQEAIYEHDYAQKRKHDDHTYAGLRKRPKTNTETGAGPSTSSDVQSIKDLEYNISCQTSSGIESPTESSTQEIITTSPVSWDLHLKDVLACASTSSHKENITRSIDKGKIHPTDPKLLVCKHLIFRKKCMISKYSLLQKEYLKSKKQLSYLKRARRAMKFSKEKCFEKITGTLNPLAKKIIWLQIKQCTKKSKGRRFTNEEKLIALSILKQSPKCYKFLRRIFILPCKYTLNKMITNINIETGINSQVFDAIQKEVNTWDEKKRHCSILFDELSLEPALTYEQGKDHINGFVELQNKTNDFADHALVFMLRGAICKWQQPLAYYYCKGATSAIQLKSIIKEVVMAVGNTGLLPLALVCDQGTAFQSALKSLQEDTRRSQIIAGARIDDVIDINGHILSLIYDPPHLIKGLRNNFISKYLKFDGNICKWSDIVEVYKTDCSHTQMRLLHKLNDEHVIPDKIKKMKVKNCVRVFSKSVAATLSYTAQFSHYGDGTQVSPTLTNTATAVSFFDDLFDSVNGTCLNDKTGKPLRRAVTDTSVHHKFWKEAQKKLKNIRFIDHTGKESTIPSLKNWIVTLQSFQRLWQFFKNKNIKIMRPRYYNSDPLENFFGQVRSYNFRNNDPNCYTFKNTFKSLLITRFIKFHSESYNCEEDSGQQLVKLKSLFEGSQNSTNSCTTGSSNLQSGIVENIPVTAIQERINVHSRAYTTGWVVRRIINKNNCAQCKKNLTSNEESVLYKWISHREYKGINKKKLTYPSEHAVRYFGSIVQEANEYLETNSHKSHIIKELKKILKSKYSFDFLDCEVHKDSVLECFLHISLRLAIHNWCSVINKILKGTDVVRLEKRVLPVMQHKALLKFKSKLKNKKFNK